MKHIIIVLTGQVIIYRLLGDRHRHILTSIAAGQTLGETFVLSGLNQSIANLQASASTTLAFIEYKPLQVGLTVIPELIAYHQALSQLLAYKMLIMQERFALVNQPTLKQTLLVMLHEYKKKQGNKEWISLPYKTQAQLADFLGVNRSALARVISQLQKNNRLEYKRGKFKLL